ncbi:MAG: 16S rRNA (cytosine1402-N4)-methyltransferase [Chloroflexi bacterium]|jgi:16S rRNA (cytosine1402-N4)-methyltransferase|nr:MAG: 16S rRNA (cytosine1402-N4)-methyltransferase [Chloroflexota bacterium]|tara:strand:+ start:2769 stop:3713 length:945 start_codon:yes stop_codon:yes gene_type:complete
MNKKITHKSVMTEEVLSSLNLETGKTYIDATVGAGGHSKAMLERCPDIKLIAIDQDESAISIASNNLKKFSQSVSFYKTNFANIEQILRSNEIKEVNGILFDLGTSQMQLNDHARGFSFKEKDPLDMRMNQSQEITAEKILNTFSEYELFKIISQYGEERYSKKIARAIVNRRPLNNTKDLTNIILSIYSKNKSKIHPATKTFQAIRIAVNKETEVLTEALNKSLKLLKKPGGRLVVISFHSIEDRIVKTIFNKESAACICTKELPICVCNHVATIKIINKKIIKPSIKEIHNNPSSRSARLRIAEIINKRKAS